MACLKDFFALSRRELGYNGITVFKTGSHKGYMGGHPYDKIRGKLFLTFDEIYGIIQYEVDAQLARFGKQVLRLMYPAMGSSLSEVLCDLVSTTYEIRMRQDAPRIRDSFGILGEDLSLPQFLLTARHVDDTLVGSSQPCSDCMIRLNQRALPSYVGSSCKGEGQAIHFLHLILVVRHGYDFVLRFR